MKNLNFLCSDSYLPEIFSDQIFRRFSEDPKSSLAPVIKFYLKNYSICDALRDLIPFVQYKKREKHPWRSVAFSKVVVCDFTKSNTLSWVFYTFCTLYK